MTMEAVECIAIKAVECIDPDGPKDFFDRFISKRIPVKLKSLPHDFPSQFTWDLVSSFPDIKVVVESKDGKLDQFGSGKARTQMTLKEFNDQLKDGNFYLSTQYNSDKDSKIQQILQAPLNQLSHLFPLKPEIIGNLVPQQMTLWVGYNNGKPVSSGLHHDFHDNLYLLISGEKRFKLISPKDAKCMYTVGKIKRIFENGLITYIDNIRADGANLEDVAQWRLQEAEIKLENAENGEGDLQEAEREVDDAMDMVLKYNTSELYDSQKSKKVKIDPVSEPNSFSQIKNTCNQEYLEKFPKFQNATFYDVTLKAGEALFLPAGWFHEVKSCGSTDSDGLHMAMNYWMAPPTQNDFDHPYEDGFWESQWNDFLEELKLFKA